MSTRRVTSAAERIDLHLTLAEQFLALDLITDAVRRLRTAIAQCRIEARETTDAATREEIAQRRLYAENVLRKLGHRPDREPQATL